MVLYGAAMAVMNVAFYCAVGRLPLGVAATLLFLGPFVVAVASARARREALLPAVGLAGVVRVTEPAGTVEWAGIGHGLYARRRSGRAVEDAVAAQAAARNAVVEAAGGPAESRAVRGAGIAQLVVVEEFGRQGSGAGGDVRPAVRTRPAGQLAYGSGQCGSGVAPQKSGRDRRVAADRRGERFEMAVLDDVPDPGRGAGQQLGGVRPQVLGQPWLGSQWRFSGRRSGKRPESAAGPSAQDHSRAARPSCATEAATRRSAVQSRSATVSMREVSGSVSPSYRRVSARCPSSGDGAAPSAKNALTEAAPGSSIALPLHSSGHLS